MQKFPNLHELPHPPAERMSHSLCVDDMVDFTATLPFCQMIVTFIKHHKGDQHVQANKYVLPLVHSTCNTFFHVTFLPG